MADQVTNLQLSKDIGDLKGDVGEIKGLLVGISNDLIAGRNKFIDIETRLRKVENKLAWYAGAAAIIGAGISYLANAVFGKIFE